MGVTKFDRKLIAPQILERFAAGESLRAICKSIPNGPAPSTVRLWCIQDDPPGFAEQYARAREMHADALIDQAMDIADETDKDTLVKAGRDGETFETANHEWIGRSRLRVDTRKWAAGRLAPKKWGDKIELAGDPSAPLEVIYKTLPSKT